jgi:DNA-binding HxlR family transcriptional regulator
VAPNTLSARLKTLERRGIIGRDLYSDHPPRLGYRLTDRGRTLGPIVKALRDWGKRYAS